MKPLKIISYRGAVGGVLIMTLVFVSMFLVIFVGLSGMISRSYKQSVLQAQDELAFQVAESGLNYARWRLAHETDNLATESRVVTDQFAGDLGSFDLSFEVALAGSSVVTVTSVGKTANQPIREVVLKARYGRPSLARFSSITNGDVWYGGPVKGAVHANGGIRMDGESDSLMTSAMETYACQPYHGCSSPFETKPGIWGSGGGAALWKFPAPSIDYNALTLDLLDMKEAAVADDTYYPKSNKYGYQIEFHDDNTYSIYVVNKLGSKVWSWWTEGGWKYESYDVGTLDFIENSAVPSGGVIFAEDTVWAKGDVRDRVTVAAGRFPDTPASNKDIILNGNITYGGVKDGTRSFAAVAQRHILIPWSGAPDTMEIDGAYIAQKGSFHRRYYPNCCGAEAHHLKTKLIRYGMIASNGVPVTAWVDGGGSVVSGFQQGEAVYDPNMLYAPPPYFPTSGEYQFISWEEEQ